MFRVVFIDVVRHVYVLTVIDRRVRFRRWMRRFPSVASTSARLRGIIAVAIAAAGLLLTGLFTVLGLSDTNDPEVTALQVICLVFLGLSFLSLYRVFDLDDCLSTYDFPDLRFNHSFGIAGGGAGLVSRFMVRPLIVETGSYMFLLVSAAAATALSGMGFSLLSAVAAGGALLLCSRALTRMGKVLAVRSLLLLPPRYLGIGIISLGALGPLTLSVLIVAVAPWIIRLSEKVHNSEEIAASVIHEILDIASIKTLVNILADGRGAFWLVPLLFAIAVSATGLVVWAAPRNDYRLQLKLKQPIRWRINADFPRRLTLASADKDARLLIRRGYPAWKRLGIVVSLAPVVAGLAVTTQVLGLSGSNDFIPRYFMTTTILMCSIIAVLSFASMFIAFFLSVELDGKIMRFIRSQRTVRTVFLGAKVQSSVSILICIGMLCVLIAHFVVPWPGLSAVGAAVCVGLFALAECLSVVIGSAASPALFLSEVNVPEPEPSVQIVNGLLTMLAMVVGTPLMLLGAAFMEVPSAVNVGLVLIIGCLCPWIGRKLSVKLSLKFLEPGSGRRLRLGSGSSVTL